MSKSTNEQLSNRNQTLFRSDELVSVCPGELIAQRAVRPSDTEAQVAFL